VPVGVSPLRGVLVAKTTAVGLMAELADLSQSSCAQDRDALLMRILSLLRSFLGVDRALFALCDEAARIRQAVTQGFDWTGDLDDLPISRSLLREVVAADDLVLVPDTASDPRYAARESIRTHDIRLLLGVPIRRASSGMVGVLYADAVRGTPEQQMRIETLRAVTGVVGLLIDNAELKAERVFRRRLLGRLGHDLRGHLHVARLHLSLLQMEDAGVHGEGLDSDWLEVLGEIDQSLQQLSLRIDGTVRLSRIESADAPEDIDVETFLEDEVRAVRGLASHHDLALRVDIPGPLPPVVGWRVQARCAFDNLVGNAIKHARPGSTVTIRARQVSGRAPAGRRRHATGEAMFLFERLRPLRARWEAGFVEVSVHNEGRPIPERLRPDIFRAFIGTDEPLKGPVSSGLGLAIAAEAVERQGGRLWLERSGPDGTCFCFTLPCAVDRRESA